MVSHPRIPSLVSAIALTLALTTPASAQYFGRNKVQYKKLDFQVLKTEHFDIYFYPEEREGIDIAARMAERWNARFERLLGHTLRGRQPLVLYASHPDFEQTNAIEGELSEGTGGVTEPLRRRIVLPMGGPLADTDHVIGHELVHAFQFDMTTREGSGPGQNAAERLPLWFIEGMAEYLSLGPVDPNTAMWLRDAVRIDEDAKNHKDALPSIGDLDNPKYFPYRWGQAFWAYVGGRYGDAKIPQMLRIAAAAGDVNVAIEKVLGVKTKELSDDWHAAIKKAYEPVLAAATPPNEIGTLVVQAKGLGADLNVGPSISPDGKWIAFLSTRSVFSIDLFVADAATGKIVHKLTSTASDPHFSSIQFIYSAGGWDRDSKRLAIATVVEGRPALAIFDAASGSKEREVPIRELDEIFNPTWAPDGHAICFTGMSRGLTDLWVYDFTTSKLRQLTNDAYADLMPAWSPDGRRIAFATDRFSSDLGTLDIGQYRLALVDPESGAVEQVRAFTTGKNINPQWTPDGRSLAFLSDRDGIPNLYRVNLATGAVTQLTRVATGLSGITSSSPAMTVASSTGVAAFSVYENGKYDIYTLEMPGTPPAKAGGVGTSGETAPSAGALPPIDRVRSDVESTLTNATFGLPAPQTYEVKNYSPKMTLEAVSQPTIAVGASRFGAAIGGGIAFQFGDMLGDHSLQTIVQVNSGVTGNFSMKNTAAEALYLNQAHRWNWGLVAGQVPYLSGGFASNVGQLPTGETVETDQTIIFRQTEQSVGGLVTYPFNRSRRIEFQGSVTRMLFDEIVDTQAFSLDTGQLLAEDSRERSLASPLTLASPSAALVFDTSSFGATSPVQGQRYRFEASPTFGSIRFTTAMADYRRYFMPGDAFYTIAIRGMHYGRYGSGGEDSRLFPLFLGYPNLVRGYDVGTFQTNDCTPTAASQCPQFDRLMGSRLLVGNLELRFPLLRPFGATQGMYGPIPVEVAFFADGGVAWNSLKVPSTGTIFGAEAPNPFNLHDGVSSAGVTLRVNLLGFAIGQFDFSHPFQRAGRGWVFQFNLSPGF